MDEALRAALQENARQLLTALERRDGTLMGVLVQARHGLVASCLEAARAQGDADWLARLMREQQALVAAAEAALSGVGAELGRLHEARDVGRRYHPEVPAPRVIDQRR